MPRRAGLAARLREAVDAIVRALAADDRAAAEKAARASGLATAAAVDPAIEPLRPPAFLQPGVQAPRGFDRPADPLRAGAPRGATLESPAGRHVDARGVPRRLPPGRGPLTVAAPPRSW